MGVIITLRDEIEALIGLMNDVTYLRASRGEANIALTTQKVNKCLAIHTDQTTATGAYKNGRVTKTIPTEILFLYKNKSLDEKLYNVDKLVNKAEDKADEFFDKLIQSSVINDLADFDDYELQRLEAYKYFDAITSGVLFTWNTPVSRTFYYCN